MSLKRLTLRDFVIVRELDLELNAGLTVLTGETGAGKSILIDALQLALGERAGPHVVREGASRADITAEFETPEVTAPWLEQNGFDAQQQLLLRRVIDSQGKSRAWINGAVATTAQLRELGEHLVDIHGQHAWQHLTRAATTSQLLDGFGQINTTELQMLWALLQQAKQQCQSAQAAMASLAEQKEELAFKLAELDKLQPLAHEWESLNDEQGRLANMQALMDTATQNLEWLIFNDQNAVSNLSKAVSLLQKNKYPDPLFTSVELALTTALEHAKDAAHSLQVWLKRADTDPQRLQWLDQRLSAWLGLSRKFRQVPNELPAYHQSLKTRLHSLEASGDLASLEKAHLAAFNAWQACAHAISGARQTAASALSIRITEAMQHLGMPGGRFLVEVTPCAQPSANGQDDVVFMVAGHAGVSPKPISKVASGGELSRIALAIAVTTSQRGHAPTLIFDEVDSGIGGAVAFTVGQLMRQLAESDGSRPSGQGLARQVLAVTHLPQVASQAHHHIVVSKKTDTQGTYSELQQVGGEGRVREIARMLGSTDFSITSMAHAQEMLTRAGNEQ